MSVQTTANCTFSLGTTTEATDLTSYEGDTYQLVGEIEELGEFGDQINGVNFTSLNDGRVRKYKGSRDAGDMTLTIGFDASDAGQAALKAALDDTSQDNYNCKVALNDALTQGGEPTTFYFSGKIMSRRIQTGSADDIVRASVTIGISTGVLEKVAA